MPSKKGVHPAYREKKEPTAEQKRWTRLSNEGDVEKKPFKSGSASMTLTKEQQRDSRTGANTVTAMSKAERAKLPEDDPYKKGFFERSYAQANASNADSRNVREAKINKEIGHTVLKPSKYSPEGEKK